VINLTGTLTLRGFASYTTLWRAAIEGMMRSTKVGHHRVVEIDDLVRRFGNPDRLDARMTYLGIADLSDRWNISVQAVHKRIKGDFPPPTAIVNRGKTRIYELSSIKDYETTHNIKVYNKGRVNHFRDQRDLRVS
jgi:hypothetical protein